MKNILSFICSLAIVAISVKIFRFFNSLTKNIRVFTISLMAIENWKKHNELKIIENKANDQKPLGAFIAYFSKVYDLRYDTSNLSNEPIKDRIKEAEEWMKDYEEFVKQR